MKFHKIAVFLIISEVACLAGRAADSVAVDFGPNVSIFDSTTPVKEIQAKIDSIFKTEQANEFGFGRHALLFKPGTYAIDANIGFYTEIAGLGFSPDDVVIQGHVRAEADWSGDNALVNFWRSAENMAVIPPDGNDRWAVSQASPFRRMHIRGKLQLDPRGHGYSSGGFIADTEVDGEVFSGSQQQYMSRNCQFGSWQGSVWNMVFVGVLGAPPQHFPNPSYTVIAKAPITRERPFLYIDATGGYHVFLPSLEANSDGTTWSSKSQVGTSLPINQFFIVKPGNTAAEINAELAKGRNLLVTPGIYHLDQTIAVDRPDTVVLGLGLATLVPDKGIVAMKVADVDGVMIAGLLFDAGSALSPTLLEIGPAGSNRDHSANPTSLHDVFSRVGGATVGSAGVSLAINSKDVIADDVWLWRADHGKDVGWNVNRADDGLVVHGDNVTAYGLFVEHFQKNNVLWEGNGGRTYMFQNEMPYDPPSQKSWGGADNGGYAAYEVADSVSTHEAWGLGSYCCFTADPSIIAEHGFAAPEKPGVRFHDLLTVSLGGHGEIAHIINHSGAPASGAATVPQYLPSFP